MTTPPLPTTLPGWLSYLYQADIKQQLAPAMVQFQTALAADPTGLTVQAQANMVQLDELIAARGRQACDYSAKYDDYLHEALDAGN